jgi:hypothetical protein
VSDSTSRLPERPSLEQLRKQAKDLLKQHRANDPAAKARLQKHKTITGEPILADAQFVLAREHGFDSWPKLLHYLLSAQSPDLDQHQRIAEDMLAAYNNADEQAAARLNDLFHSTLNVEQIHDFIRDRLFHLPDGPIRVTNCTLLDTQTVVARLYGFTDWTEFVASTNAPTRDVYSAPFVLSSRPPFYRIDWTRNSIEPRQPMSKQDWENVCGVIKELGLTAIHSANMIGDDDLDVISKLDQITTLNLNDSKRLTESGIRYLARMPQLRKLILGGQVTNPSLEVLRHLPELREFEMFWQARITDEGIVHLRHCEQLESVDLLGCNLGDGAIAALTGKVKLRRFKTGKYVTNDGLKLLHQFPLFESWHGGEARFGLMSFAAEATNLLIDGPFTAEGLANLRGLDGVSGLSFFWHSPRLQGDDLRHLSDLANLSYLGCQGALCNDDAMRHIAAHPRLRMLMGQGTEATTEGFKSLSQSPTIEYFWGRDCPNFNGQGFVALSKMRALKGLAISCKFVDDPSLAALADFMALTELVTMDVSDDGFRHVGSNSKLESLILMYCRDTGDVATSHLVGMPKLKKYHAGYTVITDRSLELLSTITSLEELSFEGCKFISDAGIPFLTTMPRLREISIGGSPRVTRSGVMGFSTSVRVNYDTR